MQEEDASQKPHAELALLREQCSFTVLDLSLLQGRVTHLGGRSLLRSTLHPLTPLAFSHLLPTSLCLKFLSDTPHYPQCIQVYLVSCLCYFKSFPKTSLSSETSLLSSAYAAVKVIFLKCRSAHVTLPFKIQQRESQLRSIYNSGS